MVANIYLENWDKDFSQPLNLIYNYDSFDILNGTAYSYIGRVVWAKSVLEYCGDPFELEAM